MLQFLHGVNTPHYQVLHTQLDLTTSTHSLPCLYTGILPAGPITFPQRQNTEFTLFEMELKEK
jgi:hypothetical protein